MLNILSLIVGVIALFFAVFAFIPLFGWAYWFIIPIALVGTVLGMLSRDNAGRNLNLFVVVVGVIRLSLGGGIF